MASSSACSLTDGLLCPVCCEQIKQPKMIPCGHSFCLEPCLRDLLKTSSTCPLCRKDIQAPSSGLAEDFPTNFALQSLSSSGISDSVQSVPSAELVDKQMGNQCGLHSEELLCLCETCSESLCEECRSTHDQSHKIEEVKTIAERKIKELKTVTDKITQAEVAIRASRMAVKETKTKCEARSKQAVTDIGVAVASVISLARKREKELYKEVSDAKARDMKKLREVEATIVDLELMASHTKGMGESLMKAFNNHDVEDDGTMDALLKRQGNIQEEVTNLNEQLHSYKTALLFEPGVPADITLGHVNCKKEKQTLATAIQLHCFQYSNKVYKGYVWFSLTELFLISGCKNGLTFMSVMDNNTETVLNIPAENIDVIHTVLCKNGRDLLMSNSNNVFKVTPDFCAGKMSFCKQTIKNPKFHRIQAVSWDETREGCYVLLHDKVSICHFSFDDQTKNKKSFQLKHQVDCGKSDIFHISEFGGMAIGDHNKGLVEFFTEVQPHVAGTVKAPRELFGARVTSLTSRGSDRKWFVNWAYKSKSYVTQYSESFHFERLVLSVAPIGSFHFLDEKYFITLSQEYSKLVVYRLTNVDKV